MTKERFRDIVKRLHPDKHSWRLTTRTRLPAKASGHGGFVNAMKQWNQQQARRFNRCWCGTVISGVSTRCQIHSIRGRRAIALLASWLVLLAIPASAVKLAWDAPNDASVVGYRIFIYWQTATGTNRNSMTIGNVTTAEIAELKPSTKYYFSVASRNSSGVESEKTGTIVYETPPAPSPPDPATNRIETVTITITNGTFGVRTN